MTKIFSGELTFHLSISSVSHGFSLLFVEGIFGVLLLVKINRKMVNDAKFF